MPAKSVVLASNISSRVFRKTKIIDPEHLLEQAGRLARSSLAGSPTQTDLRRAISAAYYAIFHRAMIAVADEFVGAQRRGTSRYGLVYRSVDHKRLKELSEDLTKQTPPEKYTPYLPASGFGPNITAFCLAAKALQEKRHAADYDPISQFGRSEVLTAIRTATAAIRRFDRASAPRRKAFLTLLMFPPKR